MSSSGGAFRAPLTSQYEYQTEPYLGLSISAESNRINFSSLVVERVVERLMINASKFALGTSHCTRHDLPLFPMAHTPGWGVEKGGLDHACVYKDL